MRRKEEVKKGLVSSHVTTAKDDKKVLHQMLISIKVLLIATSNSKEDKICAFVIKVKSRIN